MPGIAGSIVSSDPSVEEAAANVRILGLELVGDDSLFILLGDFLDHRRSLGGDLGSYGDQPPASLRGRKLCSRLVEGDSFARIDGDSGGGKKGGGF